ncbi:MAG: excinuclease ABC subunit UvrB [bacterium]
MNKFQLRAPFQPTGDQPQAIEKLLAGLKKGYRDQTLLGVTGSGKTFTMANVIAAMNTPTLVMTHNKTLAAQLASEFREFFPKNAVDYFVSYYDYYQPEAYVPRTDTYIEKETQINEEIDRLRNAATRDLLTRRDVIIVASVSCIYGLGSPVEYARTSTSYRVGQTIKRQDFLRDLGRNLYDRNDIDFRRGTYRVRGDVIELHPSYSDEAVRFEFFGDEIEAISMIDSLTGKRAEKLDAITIFPSKQFVTNAENMPGIIKDIRSELQERIAFFKKSEKPLEAERIEQRTSFDLEMMETVGYCTGIENYSRFFAGRKQGEPPYTLMDYFPDGANGKKDFLLFIDESHMTLPQIRGMYNGDKARKQVLADYGFRLPSALDNRPLQFAEFDARIRNVVYVSATPAAQEIEKSKQVVEQVIRPTGLLDPTIEVLPTEHQVDDLLERIRERVKKTQRVLVTTLTKRIAEDLSEYLEELGVKVHYLHSDVDTMERLEILRDLRLGTYDVVVGINLLREGLDLPEVSLIAILDADKEGYLRSATALIQTMGRAARHIDGHVVMYADRKTDSMKIAMRETERRRKLQQAYNEHHGITPKTIQKAIRDERLAGAKRELEDVPTIDASAIPKEELPQLLRTLEEQMELAAQNLEFEKAAALRDDLQALRAVASHPRSKKRRRQ